MILPVVGGAIVESKMLLLGDVGRIAWLDLLLVVKGRSTRK
jgi:hypothetical protein